MEIKIPDSGGNVDLSGYVQSVNGQPPDENGNVEIDCAGSWNDLADKPFGEVEAEEVILEETEVTTTPTTNNNAVCELFSVDTISGEQYNFIFDGVEYKVTAEVTGASVYVGNYSILNSYGDDTGEPFVLCDGYLYTKTEGTYIISIKHVTDAEIVPLDEKYIPDTIARVADVPKTASDVGALPLDGGGTVIAKKNDVLTINADEMANVYYVAKANGLTMATFGHVRNMACISNERAKGARIGVDNNGVPQYRSTSNESTAQTLLHTGNAEEKLNLLYTDAPIPFAEQQCGQPVNNALWVTGYVYQKGYVQHIKTRVMEGTTGVAIIACIFKAHDMTLLRRYTTTADAGEVIIPVEEYIDCDFYVGLVGEGLDFKSFKYSTYPYSYIACSRAIYLDPLSEGDILNRTFTEMTADKGSYVVAQEVTYNGRYNTSSSHTYTRNKMFAVGDSITAGYPSYTEGIHWWETVGRTLGYDVTVGAKSGSGISYYKGTNACKIVTNTDFSVYDVAVFAFGTNDYGNDIPIGTIDDAYTYVEDSSQTFYAAVKYVVEKVLTSNPTCMLIFALPINRCDKNSTFETNWCYGKANTAGHTLSDYCDAIIAVCNKYGIPYIDRRNGIVNAYTVQTLMCDKLHPTDEGYKLLGMELSARIGALIRPYAEYNGGTA